MAAARDEWLSDVLGVPAFAVPTGSPVALPPGPSFAFAKVPVAEVAEVTRLAAAGFVVVDVNLTFARPRGGAVPAPAAPVATADRGDGDALVEIAGRCFRYSRFHLDPRLAGGAADRVKRAWVRSYLEGRRGLELLAVSDGGRPAGFLAVLDVGDARVIDLVGVAPEHQGRGLGEALVAAFVARHAPEAAELRVGTQAANIPSVRLYEKLGFRFVAAAYVLHRHGEA